MTEVVVLAMALPTKGRGEMTGELLTKAMLRGAGGEERNV